jgi:hypothetical protein
VWGSFHARRPMDAESPPTKQRADAIYICTTVILIRTWYLTPSPQPQSALESGAFKTITCLRPPPHHHHQRPHLQRLPASHLSDLDVQSERLSRTKRNRRQLDGIVAQKREQTKERNSSPLMSKRKRNKSRNFAGSLLASTWTNTSDPNIQQLPRRSRYLEIAGPFRERTSHYGPGR